MKSLHIGPDLTLPLDAVTQTFGILAVRGAGKSNLGAVMAEEMFAAGLPFVALDQLASVYPATLSKDELARRAGYEPNGGGFNNALSRLRTLELIEGRGEMRASEGLFG